jgi:hypothetical protein
MGLSLLFLGGVECLSVWALYGLWNPDDPMLALWELPGYKLFLKTNFYQGPVIFYAPINQGRCP